MADASAGFAAFLARSLRAIEVEVPAASVLLRTALDGRDTSIRIDGERLTLLCTGDVVSVATPRTGTRIDVRASKRLILDLVDGCTSLVDAVTSERLELRGNVQDLARLHEGLTAFLHGAVRSPTVRDLLARYREAAPAGSCTPLEPGDAPRSEHTAGGA